MSNLADLKSALTRLDAASERADALEPGLPDDAREGLDVVRGNTRLMRAELDELLLSKPELLPNPDVGRGPEEQAQLDSSVKMLTEMTVLLERWLEEWGA